MSISVEDQLSYIARYVELGITILAGNIPVLSVCISVIVRNRSELENFPLKSMNMLFQPVYSLLLHWKMNVSDRNKVA